MYMDLVWNAVLWKRQVNYSYAWDGIHLCYIYSYVVNVLNKPNGQESNFNVI